MPSVSASTGVSSQPFHASTAALARPEESWADKLDVGGGALHGEVLPQRDEGLRRLGIERRRVVGPFDLVHVEVTSRPGDRAEPREVVAGPLTDVVGEHLGGVRQHDPRPAHGDTQIVKELGVDVGHRPVPVGEQRVAEVGEDGPISVDRRVVVGQRDADRHAVAVQWDTSAGRGELGQISIDGSETESVEQVTQLAGGLGVAGQLDRLDDDAVEDDSVDGRDVVDGDGRRDLAVGIALGSRGPLRRDLDESQQGPHVEEAREAAAQRAGGKIVGDPRLPGNGDPRRDAVLAAERELAPIDEFEAQAGLGDAPIERVEHGDRRGRRRLRDETGALEGVDNLVGARFRRGWSVRRRSGGHRSPMLAPLTLVCGISIARRSGRSPVRFRSGRHRLPNIGGCDDVGVRISTNEPQAAQIGGGAQVD